MPQFTILPVEVQTMIIDFAVPGMLHHSIEINKDYYDTLFELMAITRNLTLAYPTTIYTVVHVLKKRSSDIQAAISALPKQDGNHCALIDEYHRCPTCRSSTRRSEALCEMAADLHRLELRRGLFNRLLGVPLSDH
jgi:hypothetical protein